MTTMSLMEMKCAACKKTSEQPVISSTNQFGYQDLDTRPSEMYRSTMETWLYECPHCGYVAERLDKNLTINKNYLKSDRYKTCDGINFKSELSKVFYKKYLIETEKSDDVKAFFAILECAWTCDDAEDANNSKLTRQIAIENADKIISSDKEDTDNFLVIKSDLLRRIDEFEVLIEEYENLRLDDELLNKIIRFEVEKAHKKDNKCYTLEEVL